MTGAHSQRVAPVAGSCRRCGKVNYASKREAKRALSQDHFRSDKSIMSVYRCGQFWHVGHTHEYIKQGILTRDEAYSSREGTIMNSSQTTYEVDINGTRYPVEGWFVTSRGDITPVFNGGLTRQDCDPQAWVRVIPKVTIAAILMTPLGVVVGRRDSRSTHAPGLWEIAGGKPNTFEDDESALKRELKEEYGLTDVVVRGYLGEYSVSNGYRARVYRAMTLQTPTPLVHEEIAYLDDNPRKIGMWAPGNLTIVQDFLAGEAA